MFGAALGAGDDVGERSQSSGSSAGIVAWGAGIVAWGEGSG